MEGNRGGRILHAGREEFFLTLPLSIDLSNFFCHNFRSRPPPRLNLDVASPHSCNMAPTSGGLKRRFAYDVCRAEGGIEADDVRM